LAFASTSALALAPTSPLRSVSRVTLTSAILEADVNPQGKATKYHFEYGTGDCATSACTQVPATDLTIPSGTSPVRVSAEVTGLSPATAYHFRIVAKNSEGELKSPDRSFSTHFPPQVFSPCPNDQLRNSNPAAARIEYSSANLPDCRAYEQASPVNKDAGDAAGTAPFTRAALQGGAISFLSVSGMPGGLGSQDFPPFLASRNVSWSSHGLLPPGDSGQSAAVLGWSEDFSHVYTKATQLGEPRTTALMAAAPGAEPQQVTPYVSGSEPDFAASSDGGAEAIFESNAAIPGVPGALANKPNVYLWDETSKELSLGAVMNDELPPPTGAIAGPYDWINGTTPTTLVNGGADRRYYLQDTHAIAKDGSALYFTAAGTGQLYARLNPTESQSDLNGEGKCTKEADACTVHASASKRTIPDPAGARPAAFMGASADGTKSLFTSSEMLTNNANTGPEQEPAAIERADRDGTNVDPDCVLTHATGLAVDAGHIYWVDPISQAISRAKIDCTNVEPAFIVPPEIETEPGVLVPANLKGLAVFGDQLYWTTAGKEDGEGVIGKAKLNGDGAATEVDPSFIEGAGNPQAVAASAEYVFWTSGPKAGTGIDFGFIGRAKASDGGEVIPKLVKTFIQTLELPGIALDASHVYWMDRSGISDFSLISRANLNGTGYLEGIQFILLGQNLVGKGVAIEGNQIYWATQANERIGKANLNGDGAASEVNPALITNADNPGGVALDPTHVYWGSNGNSPPNPGNDLYRYDASSETLADLAPDSTHPNGTEVKGVLGASADASRVYFAANGVPDGLVGSPNARGEVAAPGDCTGFLGSIDGSCNLYLADGGQVRFIARLDIGNGEAHTDAANWAPTPKQVFPSVLFQKMARVSADGGALLFRSQRQLADYENNGTPELYLYRAGDDGVSCVSCNPTGEAPSGVGQAELGSINTPTVFPTPPNSTLSHNLSADGSRVFFETPDALAGADTNGQAGCPPAGSDQQSFPACTDVYEWEAQGTGTCSEEQAIADGGCLYLISTGKGTEPALIADASADGKEVYFFSRSRLVGQDEDQLQDVYTATVDGGLLSQNGPPPNPCLSIEACHPQGSQPPEIALPPKFSGPGNPKSKKPACKAPKRKVKGRCVAKKHKKGKGHGKGTGKANAKGRAVR